MRMLLILCHRKIPLLSLIMSLQLLKIHYNQSIGKFPVEISVSVQGAAGLAAVRSVTTAPAPIRSSRRMRGLALSVRKRRRLRRYGVCRIY